MKRIVNQETQRIPDGYPPPRDILRQHYPRIKDQLCIKGGWGYSQKDAVIVFEHDDEINPDKSFDGISLEKVFINYRLREEAEYAHDAKYVGVEWDRTKH